MKKNLLTALGLMGIMGTLSIGVVNADVTVTPYPDSNIDYRLNDNTEHFTGVGTITITDDGTTITILDRNLGATVAGTGCDKNTNGNQYCAYEDTYGYHFQRGNNYGFKPGCNLSGSTYSCNDSITSSAVAGQVNSNTIVYNPSNQQYYTSGVFYKGGTNRLNDNSKVDLWGGSVDDTDNLDSTGWQVTNPAQRRGPCPENFHVPSRGELNKLKTMMGSASAMHTDLLIPFASLRNYDASLPNPGGVANLWSSSPNSASNPVSRFLLLNVDNILNMSNNGRANAYSVRCFYDEYTEYVAPAPLTFTLTFTGSGQGSISTGSIEVESGSSISRNDGVGTVTISGTVVATGIANEGYVFSGWLTDCAGPTVTAACSFTGEFKPITYSVQFTGTDVSGTMINQSFTYDVAQDLTANAFTKTGYTFSGWTDGTTGYTDGQEVSNLTAIDGDTVTLTAQWTANTYTVKFDAGEGNGTMDDQEFIYDVAQDLTGNKFTRDGYTFSGWTDGINVYTDKQNVNNLTGTNGVTITLTAQWTQNTPSGDSNSAGGSSGGGGSRKASSTNDSSKSTDSQTGNETDSSTNASNSEENTQDSAKASEGQNQGKTYSDEMKKAYEFAYKHGITTMDSIEKADMEGPLTRIAMAKMLSQYAMNVLGQKPANIIVPKFKDVSDELDAQYDYGVTLAYQLGIMGINMKNNRFRPNDLVTRGEFATALSRMLYGIADGKDKYYSTHLAKLMEEKIITNDDPMMKELRGYVMIMLIRSAEDK